MEALSFNHIQNLEKSRTDWRIKVRVTRKWPTVSSESGTTKGFNLILLDDDNSHIHSFAYADVWKVIGKDVNEGSVYIVQTFIVRDAVGNLKPVSTDLCIRFTNATTFESCVDEKIIPAYKFEFLDLGDVEAEANRLEENENPEFAIDVIGVVEDYEKVRKIGTKFGERDIVRFKLCDGSYRHRVGIWGDLALSCDDEYYKHDPEKTIIVILASTKMAMFKNSVQISTLPSTKVYFNLDDESVIEMRQRLEDDGYKAKKNVDEHSYALTIVSSFEKLSLQDLSTNISEKLEKKIYSTFTIAKLEDCNDWYLDTCSKCHLVVELIERRFKCNKCTRNMPLAEKRFCVKVTAVDSTFNCIIFLMDRVVKRLLGCSASNLYQSQSKDYRVARVRPALLTSITGKEVTTTIEVLKGSEEDATFLINAEDIYDLSTPDTSITESSYLPEIPAIDLTESFDDAVELSKTTPGSARSVNKKIKMEK